MASESIPKLINNEEFVSRFNRGDEGAFLQVYDHFVSQIFRHLFLRTSSREAAEDLTSVTFLKTWEYVRRGGEIRNIKAFLYRIAQNLLIDYWRSRPGSDVPLEISEFPLASSDANPADLASQEIDIRIMQEELAGLKGEYRDILIWRYVDELTISEVADVSGKSSTAVYVTIHRALKALRKRMEQRFHPDNET